MEENRTLIHRTNCLCRNLLVWTFLALTNGRLEKTNDHPNRLLGPQFGSQFRCSAEAVYKDFPIEGHPWATRAAVDADCLASLNSSAYWAYVDYVHKNRVEINGPQMDLGKSFQALDNIASKIGDQSQVVEPELAMCLKQQDQSVVNSSLKLGRALGLEATPQVFVDGERLPAGARPTSEL